jgi:large subunit ribosomal protein L4
MIAALSMRGPWLVVVPEHDENAWKSARNVEGVSVIRASDVNAYDLLRHRTVIFTRKSFDLLMERLSGAPKEAARA